MRGELTFVGIRHEGAAAFAASRLRQAHRAPGRLLRHRRARARPTSSPGCTTPVRTGRRCSRSPARCRRACSGRGAFQDLDLEAAFADVADLERDGRAGSDHAELDEPRDEARDRRARRRPPDPPRRGAAPRRTGDATAGSPTGRLASRDRRRRPPTSWRAAVAMIAAARRPMIVVGRGRRNRTCRGSSALAERLGAPVGTTFKAKGLVSDRHPLGCGVMGRIGHTRRQLVHERERPAGRVRRVASRTTPASPRTSRSSRSTTTRWRSAASTPSTSAVLGDVGVTAAAIAVALAESPRSPPSTSDPTSPRRWAIWRAEKARRARRRPPRTCIGAAVFDGA